MTKEGLIKSVRIGNKILEHYRQRDEFGILRDMFDIIITGGKDEQGRDIKTHFPFYPPLKVNNYSGDLVIGFEATDYSEDEMLKILKRKEL